MLVMTLIYYISSGYFGSFVAEKVSTKKSPAFRRAGSGDGNDDYGGDLLAGMGFGSEARGSAGNQPKSKLDELLGKNISISEGELHSFCFT
jgi:hypothetical protein